MHKNKPKKHFSHRGGGGGEYVSISSNAYSDLYDCMTLTLSNLIVRRIRLMVLSRNLTKDGYCFYKRMVIFYIPFILICNWIKQAEIVRKLWLALIQI